MVYSPERNKKYGLFQMKVCSQVILNLKAVYIQETQNDRSLENKKKAYSHRHITDNLLDPI